MATNKATSLDRDPIQLGRLKEILDAAGIYYTIHVHSLPVHSAQDGVEQGSGGLANMAPTLLLGTEILIVGVDKLLTAPAKCCRPAPPDPIVGFVTLGHGVTIHRRGCANVARLEKARLVPADWGEAGEATFPVDIVVQAVDRTGLLRDIGDVLTRERINVTATNTSSRNMTAQMRLTVEVESIERLQKVLALIREVPGVLKAGRR